MALLKLSGMATAISGKLGGSVFATTGNGSVLKQNSYSQQHATPLQSAQRTQIYQSSQLWRSLTPTQKAGWAAAVVDYPYTNKVGDTVYYTGYQLFNYLNQNLILVQQAPILTAPSYVAPVTKTLSWNTLNTTQIRPSFANNTVPAAFVIYMTPPISANIVDPTKYMTLFQAYSVWGIAGTISLDGNYIAKYGTPLVGQAVWFTMKFPQLASGTNDGIYPPVKGIVV